MSLNVIGLHSCVFIIMCVCVCMYVCVCVCVCVRARTPVCIRSRRVQCAGPGCKQSISFPPVAVAHQSHPSIISAHYVFMSFYVCGGCDWLIMNDGGHHQSSSAAQPPPKSVSQHNSSAPGNRASPRKHFSQVFFLGSTHHKYRGLSPHAQGGLKLRVLCSCLRDHVPRKPVHPDGEKGKKKVVSE